MISLEELRELEPGLKDMSDAEVTKIRILLYSQAQLALKCFIDSKTSKKEVRDKKTHSDTGI